MARVRGPLFSDTAIGPLGRHLVFNEAAKGSRVAFLRLPKKSDTPSQKLCRAAYGKCIGEWRLLSDEEKRALDKEAAPAHQSGVNIYVKNNFERARAELETLF
jgi:hypothetical protein